MTSYSKEELDEARRKIYAIRDAGLITILEEDPQKGFHYRLSPVMEQMRMDSGCTQAELYERLLRIQEMQCHHKMTAQEIVTYLFAPKGGQA